jgi:GH43 family beta-xylosidase
MLWISSAMEDTQAKINRLSYYSRGTDNVEHDPLIDESDECLAKQYEWSDDHITLGEGGFLRKNVIGDDLTDDLL